MISEDLAAKANFLNPSLELVYDLGRRIIREYDMTSAGLSVIKQFKLLSQRDITRLELMDKLSRNIVIGKIRASDKEWSNRLTQCIRLTMSRFIQSLNLTDSDIVSINNDAVTVIEPKAVSRSLHSGQIHFRLDGEYRAMAVVNRIVILAGTDGTYTYKGISEEGRAYADAGIGGQIGKWLNSLSNGVSPTAVLKQLIAFRTRFIEKSVDRQMYRSLRTGLYTFKSAPSPYTRIALKADFEDDELDEDLDPSEGLVDVLIPFMNLLQARLVYPTYTFTPRNYR